jgi:hypothetical protein
MSTTIKTTAAYANEGSLALKRREQRRFIVYEGGLSDASRDRRESSRSGMPHQNDAVLGGVEVEEYPHAWELSSAQLLCVGIVIVAMVVAGLAFLLGQSAAHSAAVQQAYDAVELEEVTVHQGDTLGAIAEEHSVDGVTSEELVRLIEQENGLDGASIVPGQHLMVPVAE